MSAKDKFHDIMKDSLKNDGWVVTHEQLPMSIGGVEMYIDIAAEPLIAAEKEDQKIAVEVKGFIRPSKISEFHTAVGQFMNYRRALRTIDPERHLYLAVPLNVYETFFTLSFIQESVEDYQLHLVVYDPERKVVVEWIK